MGMFDEIWLEEAGASARYRRFQTKSLACMLESFVITKGGRMRLAGHTFFGTEEEPPEMPPPEDDVEFHGDFEMYTYEGGYQSFHVRFTHGQLEYMRAEQDMPEPKLVTVRRRVYGRDKEESADETPENARQVTQSEPKADEV